MNKSSKAALIVFAFCVLGLIMAMILQVLYEEEILIHQAITQAAMVPAIQVIIILICIMLGIIVAALSS